MRTSCQPSGISLTSGDSSCSRRISSQFMAMSALLCCLWLWVSVGLVERVQRHGRRIRPAPGGGGRRVVCPLVWLLALAVLTVLRGRACGAGGRYARPRPRSGGGARSEYEVHHLVD